MYIKKEHPITGGGRPKKEIDKPQFEGLCQIQCTKEEICAVLGVTDKTLDRWVKEEYNKSFSEIFKEKRQFGLASLRRKQYQVASSGNVTMLIFLGKNLLGQSDKVQMVDDDNANFNEFVKAVKKLK